MGRIIGLDLGERRIGVAISDPERRVAVPLRILERRGDADAARAVADLARDEGVDALVVGHPLTLAGEIGPQAKQVQRFAERLGETCHLRIELWDERLTSVQAERAAHGPRGRKTKGVRRRGPTDDLAATVLLQSYLDRHRAASSNSDV